MAIGALACLAWLGWLTVSALARQSVPAVYASAGRSKAVADQSSVLFTDPSPVAQVPAASQPVMAYSVPPGVRPGTFVPPAGGYVVQPFGPTSLAIEPALTYGGVSYPHFHTGIDIDAPLGTPVGASAAGVVVAIGAADGGATGYGNYVAIGHPQGYLTLYAHLQSITVALGENVRQLQLIGYVGSTGLSTGPHLHFEIRRYNVLVDPLPYLLGRSRASS